MLQKSTIVDILNTIKVALRTFEYNIIDLDILKLRSNIKTKVINNALIKAANTLYIVS